MDLERDRELVIEGDYEALFETLCGLGVTDGLPVVPPTHDRVRRMLGERWPERDRVIGTMPPRGGRVTLSGIAANAVMAGCRADAFAVVAQAVIALLAPAFNLLGIQTTTNPVTALVLVSGPLGPALGLNAGAGALGPGSRANATIGRAVRLCMMNLGGAWPGRGDAATLASPTKFGLCLAENEAESPWPPAHVAWGYAPDRSAVTVLPVAGPQGMIHIGARADPKALLATIVRAVGSAGSNAIFFPDADLTIVLAPEIAHTLADAGHTRDTLADAVFRRAAATLEDLAPGSAAYIVGARPSAVYVDGDGRQAVRLVDAAERVHVLVAGGPGGHSALLFGFNAAHRVTRAIDERIAFVDGAAEA